MYDFWPSDRFTWFPHTLRNVQGALLSIPPNVDGFTAWRLASAVKAAIGDFGSHVFSKWGWVDLSYDPIDADDLYFDAQPGREDSDYLWELAIKKGWTPHPYEQPWDASKKGAALRPRVLT